jgi:membrane protease YdiL (CAAX protease family)
MSPVRRQSWCAVDHLRNESLVDRLAAYARHAEAHTRTPPQGSPGRSGVPWAFFGLTYGFTWLVLLPGLLAARGLTASRLPDLALIALAQFGPSLAAFLLVWRGDGAAGARRLLVRTFDVRICPRWLLPILLLPPALAAAARLLHLSAGGTLPPAPLLEQPSAILPAFAFILLLQGPVPEEFGWRGYALDRLQARWGALTSALVLGVVWGLWHLPLFFLPAAGIYVLPFGPWFAQVVASSVLVTWLYNSTGRNLLVALLWHTMNNLALALFPTLDLVSDADPRGFIVQAVLYVLTAAAVVLIWGPRTLSHRGGALPSEARTLH